MPTTAEEDNQGPYLKGLKSAEALIEGMIHKVEEFWKEVDDAVNSSTDVEPISQLIRIFDRFHLVSRQLCIRHSDRSTLVINDEYDVQDLLHALLKLYFEDIRQEEWTPSYAAGASRMDFILSEFGIVIEVKKISEKTNAKHLADELIIDIERYKAHPNTKTLIRFVYDPDGYLSNPKGIELDLTKQSEGIDVKCYIRPK